MTTGYEGAVIINETKDSNAGKIILVLFLVLAIAAIMVGGAVWVADQLLIKDRAMISVSESKIVAPEVRDIKIGMWTAIYVSISGIALCTFSLALVIVARALLITGIQMKYWREVGFTPFRLRIDAAERQKLNNTTAIVVGNRNDQPR